jgi:hypothetical protein
MTAPTRSTAARCGSSNRCAYLAVVVGFEWPNKLPIRSNDAPPLASCEAKEWRRSWILNPTIRADLQIDAQPFLISTTWPLAVAGEHVSRKRFLRMHEHSRPCIPVNNRRAAALSGDVVLFLLWCAGELECARAEIEAPHSIVSTAATRRQ